MSLTPKTPPATIDYVSRDDITPSTLKIGEVFWNKDSNNVQFKNNSGLIAAAQANFIGGPSYIYFEGPETIKIMGQAIYGDLNPTLNTYADSSPYNYYAGGKFNVTSNADIHSIIIGSSCANIADNSFNNCTAALGTIHFPDSIKTIGDSAFRNCYELGGDIDLPDSIVSISAYAFSRFGQNNVDPKTLKLPNNLLYSIINEYAFERIGLVNNNFTLPENVKVVKDWAFFGHKFTGDLVLNDVVTLGEGAFDGNTNRTLDGELVLGAALTKIGPECFTEAFLNDTISKVTCYAPAPPEEYIQGIPQPRDYLDFFGPDTIITDNKVHVLPEHLSNWQAELSGSGGLWSSSNLTPVAIV
jgi:hypothetical protein